METNIIMANHHKKSKQRQRFQSMATNRGSASAAATAPSTGGPNASNNGGGSISSVLDMSMAAVVAASNGNGMESGERAITPPPLAPPASLSLSLMERSNSITSTATAGLANIFDGFTSRVASASTAISISSVNAAFGGDRSRSAASTPSSTHSGFAGIGGIGGIGIGGGSIASLTSIGSLGTTANALYTSLGSAFNSIKSPLTAAAAAATTAISNHLSSPYGGSPTQTDDEDDDGDTDGMAVHHHDYDYDMADDGGGGGVDCHGLATPRYVRAPRRKKSWQQIKLNVEDMRVRFSRLSSMSPTNIQFRRLTDGRTRCYFLGMPTNGWEQTLLYTDISAEQAECAQSTFFESHVCSENFEFSEDDVMLANLESPPQAQPASPTTAASYNTQHLYENKEKLKWSTVFEHTVPNLSSLTSSNYSNFSREYQLMQERKRLSTNGLTSYELHKISGRIVFPRFNDLHHCLDTGFRTTALFTTQLQTSSQWAALDPQICPHNSDLLAYICGCDIWVMHMIRGSEKRLTAAHKGQGGSAADPINAGLPSYVMQEEFNRYQGYWWQPQADDGIYRIIYEEVDESEVGVYTFPSSQASHGEVEEYRFPRAGTKNAKSKLRLVQFELNENLDITNICHKDLPYTLVSVFPWLEYIVRVGWTPDSKQIWMQILDRKQQHLAVVLIPLDNFCKTASLVNEAPETHGVLNGQAQQLTPLQVIRSETSSSWINVHDLLYFMEMTNDSVSFLWASEETGFRHLYLIKSSLLDTSRHSAEEVTDMNWNLEERIVSKLVLTSGDWEVLGHRVWVDRARRLVYFMGMRETPLEKHLYVVSIDEPENVRLLTEAGYSYLVELDESCELMMLVYCSIQQMPSSKIVRITQPAQSNANERVNGITLALVGYLNDGPAADPRYCPEIYMPELPSGDIVYAMIFKPHNFRIGIKYPTILHVYGGPEVQTVNNTFKGKHMLRMHMLAEQGYCVVCIDSRGSQHRGMKFECHIRGRMGQVELRDQIDALRILSSQLGFMDMNRLAIHGWSYGGYLSLMGLVQYPNVFKIAIAGAPVTNWEYYDTGYTERYMNLPLNNEAGYAAGSLLNYIHAFPDEENRLLLLHGLIDENVHFFHTSQLISALNKANKPYALHIFPNERHSLRNMESNKNYETKMLAFLQNL